MDQNKLKALRKILQARADRHNNRLYGMQELIRQNQREELAKLEMEVNKKYDPELEKIDRQRIGSSDIDLLLAELEFGSAVEGQTPDELFEKLLKK